MKIPILGAEYELIEQSERMIELDQDGECCPNSHTIELKKTSRDKEALLHEINHGILFEGGLFCAIDEQTREVLCQQFASVYTKLFYLRFK